MKQITKRQVLMLHSMLVSESGGLDGLRDEGLLESAINAPFQSFDDKDFYPTILEKAARICYNLVKNHPFIDGNKRIGTHCMIVFLELNNTFIKYDDKELIDIILSIADGKVDDKALVTWLQAHIS